MMDGGTLKFLLETAGASFDTAVVDCEHLKPGGKLYSTIMFRIGKEPLILSVFNNLDYGSVEIEADGWIVDAGDDCGMNHEDIVDLVLHCNGTSR